MDNKKCKKCKKAKLLNEFGIDNGSNDGHYSICKKCRSINSKLKHKKECVICKKIKFAVEFRARALLCIECMDKLKIKECPKCGEIKSFDEFNKDKTRKNMIASWCRDCNTKSNKIFREANKERYSYNANKRVRKQRDIIDEYKIEKGCIKCGYNKIASVLEFHHIDKETKEYSIGSIVGNNLKKVWREINKCIILCSNCHQEFHYYWEFKGIALEEYLNE